MLATWRKLGAKGKAAKAAPTVRTAAKRLKIPKSTLHRRAQALGGWPRSPHVLSEDTKRQLDDLLAARVSRRQIAEDLGIGEGSVSRRRAKIGELVRGQWWRCPKCGSKIVVVRCHLCQLDRPADVPLRDSGPRS